jgi:predicted transcriptional regulator
MPAASVKEKVLKAVQELPQEVTFEDAIEKLYFLSKVEKGLQQADEGRTVTHEEAKQRMQKWLK